MIRFILLAVLFIIIARVFWRVIDAIIDASRTPGGQGAAPAVRLERDPVCGTFVSPRSALSLSSGGRTHYFCSEACRAKFRP